jgi:hypothetical protein
MAKKNKDLEEELEEEFEQEESFGLSSVMRKVMVGGLSTVFMTQERARSVLRELKLPKDLLDPILSSAYKTRDEFFSALSKEIGRAFDQIDISKEARDFLKEHKIRVRAEFEFEPKDPSQKKTKKNSKKKKTKS